MATNTDTDFPDDLIAAEGTRQTLLRQLEAIPPRPWTDAAGAEHSTDRGWAPEHDQEVEELRARLREVSVAVAGHGYWETFSGPDRVTARMRLKQAAAAPADTSEPAADTGP